MEDGKLRSETETYPYAAISESGADYGPGKADHPKLTSKKENPDDIMEDLFPPLPSRPETKNESSVERPKDYRYEMGLGTTSQDQADEAAEKEYELAPAASVHSRTGENRQLKLVKWIVLGTALVVCIVFVLSVCILGVSSAVLHKVKQKDCYDPCGMNDVEFPSANYGVWSNFENLTDKHGCLVLRTARCAAQADFNATENHSTRKSVLVFNPMQRVSTARMSGSSQRMKYQNPKELSTTKPATSDYKHVTLQCSGQNVLMTDLESGEITNSGQALQFECKVE